MVILSEAKDLCICCEATRVLRLHHDEPLEDALHGVTNNLERRVFEHKNGRCEGFTKRYHLDRLVYFERLVTIRAAIAREKQIKGLLRIKKMALIVLMNPEWKDLSADWGESIGPSASLRSASG